jgi:hypothetical protein
MVSGRRMKTARQRAEEKRQEKLSARYGCVLSLEHGLPTTPTERRNVASHAGRTGRPSRRGATQLLACPQR